MPVAADTHRPQVADVEHDGITSAGLMLGDGAARIRKRHQPASESDHLGAERDVRILER